MNTHRKIRIAYIIDFIVSDEGLTGGTERQLISIIKHLDKTKFDPSLICLRGDPRAILWLGINCRKLILNVSSLTSLCALSCLIDLSLFLKKHSIDMVQTYFHDACVIGTLAARLAGIKTVIACKRDLGFWYNSKIVLSLAFINMLVSRFLCNSESVKEAVIRIEKISPKKIDVIHNGIDIDEIERTEAIELSNEYQNISKEDRIIGIISNLNRNVKRLDLFIKASSKIACEADKVKFIILGAGHLEGELRKMANQLGLNSMVVFAGHKTNPIPYLKSFDIGMLTSDSEGFSNTILEYMAVGIPVITTDIPSNKEIIENEKIGYLVKQGDHEALANAALAILMYSEKRLAFGKMAKRIAAEHYDWKVVINHFQDYYSGLVRL